MTCRFDNTGSTTGGWSQNQSSYGIHLSQTECRNTHFKGASLLQTCHLFGEALFIGQKHDLSSIRLWQMNTNEICKVRKTSSSQKLYLLQFGRPIVHGEMIRMPNNKINMHKKYWIRQPSDAPTYCGRFRSLPVMLHIILRTKKAQTATSLFLMGAFEIVIIYQNERYVNGKWMLA